jgi:hypothetical protein
MLAMPVPITIAGLAARRIPAWAKTSLLPMLSGIHVIRAPIPS